MKKKLFVLACAAALVLALPVLAFAEGSPHTKSISVTGGSGDLTLTVSGSIPEGADWTLAVDSTDQLASGAKNLASNMKVVSGFNVYPVDTTDANWNAAVASGPYAFDFTVGASYNGAKAYVYIDHHDGSSDVKTATVTGGKVAISTGLSLYTVVIDTSTIGSNANANTGSTSPQTGLDFGMVAGATIAMAAAAGIVALSLRRKTNE